MNALLAVFVLCIIVCVCCSAQTPTVSYTALSDAARKAGKLHRYANCETVRGVIKLGQYELEYAVPKDVRAYDVVPLSYRLIRPQDNRRLAVEAVAFEDIAKSGDKALYDLAVPGDMGIKIEYLGSVGAAFDPSVYIPLTPDPKTPVSPFPPYKCDPLTLAGNIKSTDAVWFKFRITNIGNTVFDPEGIGASFAAPTLCYLKEDGSPEWTATPVNGYERQLTYLYPGDSYENWTNFYCPAFGSKCRGLNKGSYRLDYRMVYRSYRDYSWGANIWGGSEFARLSVYFRVTADGGAEPVKTEFVVTDKDEKMPGYIDSFEEFMTSFRIYQPAHKKTVEDDIIYLQVAPWTQKIVLKLILTDPQQISAAKIAVTVSDETLNIRYNPRNVMVVQEDGIERPAFITQAMPGMRTGFPLGPYPEKHLREQIIEMKKLGVNVIANTCGGWWIPEIAGRKEPELHSACYKYWYDVLVRETGLKTMGWSIYPPSGISWYVNVPPLMGGRVPQYSTVKSAYGFENGVDMGDPMVPEVIAAWTLYIHSRWGDNWFHTRDGRVPVDIEDTWGWMRDDINLRYQAGPLAVSRFREWVKSKYGDMEKVNAAWGSDYKSFDDIDPEKDQGVEGDGMDHGPVYNNPRNPFHDWSPAVDDWDVFRTRLRMDIYRKANEIIRKAIPGAELAVRCEGANMVIKGDPKSDNMHWRHVYYSQRRNAMVYDVVKSENVLHFYSDYTTLPYTEAEWRQAVREMVSDRVIPVCLPQFDHMRDIVLNPHYGREYRTHYNLDKDSKGIMIHCLMAAYPWWKATYEEGGAPGILWADYLCDGFATETQKRELQILSSYFKRMRE